MEAAERSGRAPAGPARVRAGRLPRRERRRPRPAAGAGAGRSGAGAARAHRRGHGRVRRATRNAVPAGELYSSAACVWGDGLLGHQRKVHLPPAERFAYTAGDGFAAFDTPVGRLGMMICYDKLFPEAARALALDGAEIVCALAAWPVDRHAPAGADRGGPPDAPLRPLRPDARGREPGRLGRLQPGRPLGPAALPRRRQGRRPGRPRARAHGRPRGTRRRRGRRRVAPSATMPRAHRPPRRPPPRRLRRSRRGVSATSLG